MGIEFLLASTLITSAELQPAPEDELMEQCFLLLAGEGSEPVVMETSVIEMTEPGSEASLQVPEGESLAAITCARNKLRFAENDYLMAIWGIPFIVVYDNENGERSGVMLTIQDDQFAVEVSQGELTDEDRTAIVESLEGFYVSLENDNGE